MSALLSASRRQPQDVACRVEYDPAQVGTTAELALRLHPLKLLRAHTDESRGLSPAHRLAALELRVRLGGDVTPEPGQLRYPGFELLHPHPVRQVADRMQSVLHHATSPRSMRAATASHGSEGP